MAQNGQDESEISPRDLAARAAWMSHVGGLTQDQIARELGISRQRVQRLVARAAAEGLIRVRIAHPIAACLELEKVLKAKYRLRTVRVSPSLGEGADPLSGLALFAAPVIEQLFESDDQQVIAVGTGRTLRAVVEQMQPVDGSHHKLVSLNGNVAPDGSATAYEVIVRLSEKTSAPYHPMSVPLIAESPEDLEKYISLPYIAASRKLAESADIAIVGIGQMGETAPLFVDGFLSDEELADLQEHRAAGEIVSHIFDTDGRYLDHPINRRMVGVRVPVNGMPVLCIAAGAGKVPALKAAIKGGLLAGLITDETTAKSLL
ncbi:MAG: sugar-binding transcriptional regulator [Hyphomicrobiaceae bacterium]|nr:sugar-binding transcriptional regulator [Hyphomicrobiaceae bacterium]